MLSQFIKYCSAFLLCFPLLVFGQSPDGLQFVENKGQFEKQVLFRAQTGNGYIFLEKNAITLKIFNEQEYAKAHQHLHKEETEEVNTIHGQVIRYLFNKTQEPEFV